MVSDVMWRIGLPGMRYALGVVFIWFGVLKLLGISPADDLIAETVILVEPEVFIPILGLWEVVIGVCFIFRRLLRVAILLLFLQLPGTFLPLLLVPEAVYTVFPYGLTVEGQYIVKNVIIIGAALVVGGTVRGDQVPASPSQRGRIPSDVLDRDA